MGRLAGMAGAVGRGIALYCASAPTAESPTSPAAPPTGEDWPSRILAENEVVM